MDEKRSCRSSVGCAVLARVHVLAVCTELGPHVDIGIGDLVIGAAVRIAQMSANARKGFHLLSGGVDQSVAVRSA